MNIKKKYRKDGTLMYVEWDKDIRTKEEVEQIVDEINS